MSWSVRLRSRDTVEHIRKTPADTSGLLLRLKNCFNLGFVEYQQSVPFKDVGQVVHHVIINVRFINATEKRLTTRATVTWSYAVLAVIPDDPWSLLTGGSIDPAAPGSWPQLANKRWFNQYQFHLCRDDCEHKGLIIPVQYWLVTLAAPLIRVSDVTPGRTER